MTKQRLSFACWSCHREYSLLLEWEGWPKLTVECPYCSQEAVVDLDPHRQELVEIFKSGHAASLGETLELPPALPTQPPKQ